MKRIYILIISLLVVCCAWSQPVATPQSNSLLIWAAGNTNMTFDRLEWTDSNLGGGGMVGIGYQWQKRLFALNTGLEIGFQHRSLTVGDTKLSQDMLDSEGMPFTYRGWVKDRSDNMNSLDLSIPLLVGIQGKAAYLLAGLKFNINAYTWTKQSALYSTDGLYDRFYDPLINMPNHGFHDYEPATSKYSAWLGAELMGSAEMGIVIPTKKDRVRMRLGLFADYSIYQYNVRISNQQGPVLEADWRQFLQLTLNHAYLSTEGAKAALHNLNLGIKLTLQWQYNSNYPCLICRWNNGKFN